MANPNKNAVLIRPASSDGVLAALCLVFQTMEREKSAGYVEFLAEAILSGEISAEGLWKAQREGRLVGAVFSQVQEGKTAIVWPPRLVEGESESTGQRLLAENVAWLQSHGVQIAQVLLERVEPSDDALLRDGGFSRLATLIYLGCLESEFPSAPPDGPLEFEAYDPDNATRLERLLEATYEQSLDCPALDGMRSIKEVLAGYRATGDYSPQRWLIVRHAGIDVGCLLLADHPREENWELVYMGLTVPARGRGWGKQIVRHAQWLTRQAGRARLVVAVDVANRPALTAYLTTGFQPWDERHVYVKVLPGAAAPAE